MALHSPTLHWIHGQPDTQLPGGPGGCCCLNMYPLRENAPEVGLNRSVSLRCGFEVLKFHRRDVQIKCSGGGLLAL